MTSENWDRRYGEAAEGRELVWSPGPNRLVATLVEGLDPGTAIDLGAGEGRHAIWLAGRGWSVTAVDFSSVGLEQARALAGPGAERIDWVHADVTTWRPATPVDLVLVAYLHLRQASLRALFADLPSWVAPGGMLLVLGHDLENLRDGVGGPQDPDVLYSPELLALAADGLDIERCESVSRDVEKDGHVVRAVDTLLTARRRGGR